MLVLTRKAGEAIRIGDVLTITVLVTSRNRVKLGILEPPQIAVVREELMTAAVPQDKVEPIPCCPGNHANSAPVLSIGH